MSIDDLGRRSPAQAGPDLAAVGESDERGVQPLGGEVGSADPEIQGGGWAEPEIEDGEIGAAEPEIEGVDPTVVPEPTPLVLVSLGMVGLVFAGRRRLPASS